MNPWIFQHHFVADAKVAEVWTQIAVRICRNLSSEKCSHDEWKYTEKTHNTDSNQNKSFPWCCSMENLLNNARIRLSRLNVKKTSGVEWESAGVLHTLMIREKAFCWGHKIFKIKKIFSLFLGFFSYFTIWTVNSEVWLHPSREHECNTPIAGGGEKSNKPFFYLITQKFYNSPKT